MDRDDQRQFERAFSSHSCGSSDQCACGRIFWDCSENGWDWEEGEVERLEKNPNATAVRGGVERVIVQGTLYVTSCDCWHKQAEAVAAFLRDHQEAIGMWFQLEKERLQKASDRVPTIAVGP